MNQFLLVGLGGAFGAMARHGVGRMVGPHTFPAATFIANISGGLLMGLLAGLVAARGGGHAANLFFGVGILGGYTTFSTFSLELVLMLERQEWGAALFYATASVLGAVLALATGLWIARSFS